MYFRLLLFTSCFLAFVIHCNLFELSSNRQNLTETPVNRKLLKLLSEKLVEKLDQIKETNRELFKGVFLSTLISEKADSGTSGSSWQNEFFYEKLLSYFKKNIPTKNNKYAHYCEDVKINNLGIKIDHSEIGLEIKIGCVELINRY